ncbi:MAG TPA: alpha/beta hydrolase [Acidisoma sp.]|nr:alpha/beta hydrolase [Acidisoma sp.]
MLSPDARAVLDAQIAMGRPPIETLTPGAARQSFLETCPQLQGPREAVGSVQDMVLQPAAGALPLRLYRGLGCAPAEAPALVFFHGGGWVLGNLDSHDTICRWIANELRGVVLSVDYRLAPDHPFPAALEDAEAAIRHLHQNAEPLGIDAARIAVGGDSAGGNIAAVIALMARDGALPALAFQMLLYPVTDVSADQESYRRFADGYGLTRAAMLWFHRLYLGAAGRPGDWRISPLRAADLAGVAPAFVLTAGCDVLHDEARDYAARLREAGVTLRLDENPGQIHGFVSMDGYISAARPAVARAIAFWREIDAAIP